MHQTDEAEKLVPDDVIPPGTLPPLKYRDLPEPVPLRRMIGPSLILAGLALGSGEFILWPYITYKSQFVFFWACLVGVGTQYFINMEISRWTLATGETAIGGRLPVNPSGGLKARGHPLAATGISQLVELCWQLRGKAEGRQVSARVGLAQSIGGLATNNWVTLVEASRG